MKGTPYVSIALAMSVAASSECPGAKIHALYFFSGIRYPRELLIVGGW
jgi:hypothetical protein